MHFSTLIVLVFAAISVAMPTKRHAGRSFAHLLLSKKEYLHPIPTDADDSIVYPDEKLYAEEFKRDGDDSIVYPDEKLYAEEFKRDGDDAIVYPDEKLYAEEFKQVSVDVKTSLHR
jgi:hypothetical protein